MTQQNLLSASASLFKLVSPQVGKLQAKQPLVARRLRRAAERVEAEVTEAACELGRERRRHLGAARSALLDVRGCLELVRSEASPEESPEVQAALSLTRRLLHQVDERTGSVFEDRVAGVTGASEGGREG